MSRKYTTVDGTTENLIEIKRSKFIATVAGMRDGEDAENFVRSIKRRYPDATHNCYAYIADERGTETRFSDDGEPGGTAGQPMLEVLRRRGLVKTAVVVTRYFGGIKLGAGGLVGAYTDSVAQVLEKADVAEYTMCAKIRFECDYSDYSVLESALRRTGVIFGHTEYGDKVSAEVFAEEDFADKAMNDIVALTNGKVAAMRDGEAFKRR